jgi:hypothetical protein
VSDATSANPTVFLTWAHRESGWAEADEAAWRDEVYTFSEALRRYGIDVDVDLSHQSERGIDWTRFGPRRIVDCDWVIAVLSTAWRERWEGRNMSTQGSGAVGEADVLLSQFYRNQQAFQDKLVLVTLPSRLGEDVVPMGLDRVHRFGVAGYSRGQLAPLLRLLTEQPEYPASPLGELPKFPPKGQVPNVPRDDDKPAGDDPTPGGDGDATCVRPLNEQIDGLKQALRRIPAPPLGAGGRWPWSRTRQQLEEKLAALEQERAPEGERSRDPSNPPAPIRHQPFRIRRPRTALATAATGLLLASAAIGLVAALELRDDPSRPRPPVTVPEDPYAVRVSKVLRSLGDARKASQDELEMKSKAARIAAANRLAKAHHEAAAALGALRPPDRARKHARAVIRVVNALAKDFAKTGQLAKAGKRKQSNASLDAARKAEGQLRTAIAELDASLRTP